MTKRFNERQCKDPIALNAWQVTSAIDEIVSNKVYETTLLGEALSFALSTAGTSYVWLRTPEIKAGQIVDVSMLQNALPSQVAYGYIWTCLGTPETELFTIPEFSEPDRNNMNVISVGINTSAPRVVENFLDMAHFPFVHTDFLGAEPHTEVADYNIEVSAERDELLATDCVFYQPKAIASSTTGANVDYIYRVPHPYCSVLYKTNPDDPTRNDVIAIFVQPIDEEHVCGHMLLSGLDNTSSQSAMRIFQQVIIAQDKPILENQFPKKLPLDPGIETPIRCDKMAIAYRRWLSNKGLTYGVIPYVA